MSNENATLPPDLAAIQAEAEQFEPVEPNDDGTMPEQAGPVDYYTDAKGLTDIAATAIGALYPSTANVLSEQTREKFAQALAPVMEKYGVSLGSVLGRYGAEINLVFVTAGFAIPLAQAISADRQAAKAQKGEQPKQAPIEKAGLQPVIDRSDPTDLFNKA